MTNLDDALALLQEAERGFSRVLVGTSDQERVYDWLKRVRGFLSGAMAQRSEPVARVTLVTEHATVITALRRIPEGTELYAAPPSAAEKDKRIAELEGRNKRNCAASDKMVQVLNDKIAEKDAEIERLSALVNEALEDRDEWKQQHENLLSVKDVDVRTLVERNQRDRREFGEKMLAAIACAEEAERDRASALNIISNYGGNQAAAMMEILALRREKEAAERRVQELEHPAVHVPSLERVKEAHSYMPMDRWPDVTCALIVLLDKAEHALAEARQEISDLKQNYIPQSHQGNG
jgi:uncharacterized coiled-coil protein SlyX